MGKPAWSDEEVAHLEAGIEANLTMEAIQAGLPLRTVHACYQKAETLGHKLSRGLPAKMTRVVSETPERTVYAPAITADEPIEAVWERAASRCIKAVEKGRYQGLALVRIVTAKPVAISISSDWHISTTGACDLPALRTYAEAIRDAPGAFAVAVGDLHDNPIKWSKQMNEVPDELRIVDLVFGIFGQKLLGTTDGNHEAWSRMYAGVDNIKSLADRGKIHYAPDELVYVVELVDPESEETTAKYVVATRHKYNRNSQLNITHACWRWFEDRAGQWPLGDDGELIPDVLAIGDSHVAAVEERTLQNKAIWAARMGPWQTTSEFARRFGWKTYRPTAPTFILYPHQSKPVDGYSDYARALEILEMERS